MLRNIFSTAAVVLALGVAQNATAATVGVESASPNYQTETFDTVRLTFGAYAGPIESAVLSITAEDVDTPFEYDQVRAFVNDGFWAPLGVLSGTDGATSVVSFMLNATFFDEIADGLRVRIRPTGISEHAINIQNAVLDITAPVPIPAAGLLLLGAVGGLGVFGARRRRAATA